MKRIDTLTAPPEPGRFYLVPTVTMPMFGFWDTWPVIGPWHEDREAFGFKPYHVHLDTRFLTKAQQRFLGDWALDDRDYVAEAQARPLHWPGEPIGVGPPRPPDEPPEIVFRKRKCQATHHPYRYRGLSPIVRLTAAMQGARLGPKRICPHRGIPLSSIAPDAEGVVTCPGHGLRFCAESGRLLCQ